MEGSWSSIWACSSCGVLDVLPGAEAEWPPANDDRKERSVDILGRVNELAGSAFFLSESDDWDEPDACDAPLAERCRFGTLLDDGPAEPSASEMSCKPWPKLDMVRSRSTSALRHCGVLTESVKSGVPGPRSRAPSSCVCREESVDLDSWDTGTALEDTERVRARLARPLRAEEEVDAAADDPADGFVSSRSVASTMGLDEAKVVVDSELCDAGCSVLDRTSLGGETGVEVGFDSMVTNSGLEQSAMACSYQVQ